MITEHEALDRIRNDRVKFQRKRQLQKPAENTKIAVVGVLLLSVIVFTVLGKDIVKHFIWYWVAFMVVLLIICAVQDIIVKRKIKRENLA